MRGSDGREFALTRTKTDVALMRLTADVLDLAKRRGVPVPAHEVVLALSDGYVAVVQQRLPSRRPTSVDAERVEAMVAMNERFADLLSERPDVPPPSALPTEPDWTVSAQSPLHGPLACGRRPRLSVERYSVVV